MTAIASNPWMRSAAAAIATALAFAAMMAVAGHSPFASVGAILRGGFGSVLGWQETLARAIPLLFCGLAAALPARAGLLNIGGEGQLHLGAIGATFAVLALPGAPAVVLLPAMALAATVCGAFCAGIPALLRGWWKVNEVLVGLMLNYTGILLVQTLLHGPWKDPGALGWPYSKEFPRAAEIPAWGASKVHLGLLAAVLIAGAGWLFFRRTTFGFSAKILRAHERMARYLRIPAVGYFLVLMAAGGACAALAGMGEVSVVQHRLRPQISASYGYVGFMLAWLSGHHLLVLVPMTLFVAGLYAGADLVQLDLGLPAAVAESLVALIFLGVVAARAQSGREKFTRP